jgi:hypothetical protein
MDIVVSKQTTYQMTLRMNFIHKTIFWMISHFHGGSEEIFHYGYNNKKFWKSSQWFTQFYFIFRRLFNHLSIIKRVNILRKRRKSFWFISEWDEFHIKWEKFIWINIKLRISECEYFFVKLKWKGIGDVMSSCKYFMVRTR